LRVLKNREAAQQFRQRQKEQMILLQSEYRQLTEENKKFNQQLKILTVEKEKVDSDLIYARSFLSQLMSLSMANMKIDSNLNSFPVPNRSEIISA
jgi:hypothetical protein